MHFRKYKMIQKGNQKKYVYIKAANFTIGKWNNERFIRTLKSKIYKPMSSIIKSVFVDKLGDIVNEYNNTYQLKWGLLMLKIGHVWILKKETMIKVLNFTLVIM